MIWLIGNKGMLGTDVETGLKQNNIEYFASDVEVDIGNYNELKDFSINKNINWIINCAAYTAVDNAEDNAEAAYKINSEGAKNIALIAKENNAKLIHISTDYVFSGEKEGAYLETDASNPTGVYAKSKNEGEINISKVMNEFFIIRVAWLCGVHGKNFIHTILRLLKEKESLKVVNDQFGTPTFTFDTAKLIMKIINENRDEYGIYHFTNEGKTNWYEFAELIKVKALSYGVISKNTPIFPIRTEEFPTKAKRPKNSYLSKEKVKNTFKFEIPDYQVSLDTFFKFLLKNS